MRPFIFQLECAYHVAARDEVHVIPGYVELSYLSETPAEEIDLMRRYPRPGGFDPVCGGIAARHHYFGHRRVRIGATDEFLRTDIGVA